jgi:hypothetical protein
MSRAANQSDDHETDDDAFIQAVGALLIPMGMPPIAARMNGYLLLSEVPLSLDELVTGLRVSKSSASVATRILERYGIARRFTEPGTKRVRYGISGRCDGYLAEQIQFFESMGRLLRARAAAHPSDDTSPRLQQLGDFYVRLRDAIGQVYIEKSGRDRRQPELVALSGGGARSARQRRR